MAIDAGLTAVRSQDGLLRVSFNRDRGFVPRRANFKRLATDLHDDSLSLVQPDDGEPS